MVNAYQLAVTISLLPVASLGDIYGYRRVYQYGLIGFTIASGLVFAVLAPRPPRRDPLADKQRAAPIGGA